MTVRWLNEIRIDLSHVWFYSREPLNPYHHLVLSSSFPVPSTASPFSCPKRGKWVWQPGDLLSVQTSKLVTGLGCSGRWWHLGQDVSNMSLWNVEKIRHISLQFYVFLLILSWVGPVEICGSEQRLVSNCLIQTLVHWPLADDVTFVSQLLHL